MTPGRDATAAGRQIGFGIDGVEPIVQHVADIGKNLDQRDAEIRGTALAPMRRGGAQAVEHHAAQRLEIAREIVDTRPRLRNGGSRKHCLAVDVGRAVEPETDLGCDEHGIEVLRRRIDPDPVGREVAEPIKLKRQAPRILRVDVDIGDPQAAYPDAAVDVELMLGERRRLRCRRKENHQHARRTSGHGAAEALGVVDAVERKVLVLDGAPQARASRGTAVDSVSHGGELTVTMVVASSPPARR